MIRTVVRFASKVLGDTPSKKENMVPIRFFINPHMNVEGDSGQLVHIPIDLLKSTINAIDHKIRLNLKPTLRNAEEGLYLGTAGVAYMYYHLSKASALADKQQEFLSHAVSYLTPALAVADKNQHRKSDVPAFLLGNCGVYAVAAVLYNAVADTTRSHKYRQLYYEAASICKQMNFLQCGSDELFVGRAGYVLGALWMAKETNTPLQKQDIFEICRVMVASGRECARSSRSAAPLMYSYYDVQYLGAGHGISTILQVLMSVPDYLDANPGDAQDVKASVDYLLSLQDDEGNFPAATDEIRQGQNELIHWCHGAGGVIYLMAKAYLVWGDTEYLESCTKMADLIWAKGLLKKGPGICHGVAGNGYAFLTLYRLSNDAKYLEKAVAFATFMESNEFTKKARTPDNPYSLYEGVAGTACFLADLTNPTKAAFPFSDIF